MANVGVAGGMSGGGGGSCYRPVSEAGPVRGSTTANRSGRLRLGSLVPVNALKIKIIGVAVCGGWERVVLLQLVLAGQETLEGGHGHGTQ